MVYSSKLINVYSLTILLNINIFIINKRNLKNINIL